VKTALKAKMFQDAEDIEKNMTAERKSIPLDVFADCFQKLLLA
jgi:hypothetical protein